MENNTEGFAGNSENIEAIIPEIQLHPTPEQLFIREAIKKSLMNSQKKVWELYAYDQLTYAEIGRKLGISKQAATKRVATIERQITRWCKEHRNIYETIKEAEYL